MKRLWVLAGATLALLYLVIGLSVSSRIWQDWDHQGLTLLQRIVPRSLDAPFSFLSLLGSFEITLLFFALLLFLFYRPREWILLMGCFLLIVVVEWLGKMLLNQPGPPPGLHRYVISFGMPTSTVSTPYSFPSGHAARSAFLTVILASLVMRGQSKRLLQMAIVAAFIVLEAINLVSRVYLGDHWPMDVIGGVLLGVLLALPALDVESFSRLVYDGWAMRFTRSPDRSL